MDTFDYIVLGAGSAGCALAARLSQDGRSSVLLIEAGQHSRKLVNRMPAGALTLMPKAEFNWLYRTEADPSLGGRESEWPAGRTLGGGSAINGTVYTRGCRADYDGWAQGGCIGWSWDDVLPCFLKSEDFQGDAGASHARGGPLAVSSMRSPHPLAAAFVSACVEAGLREVPDYCAGDTDGAFLNLVTQKHGERWSSSRAFIEPAIGRANLTVVTGGLVDRVEFDADRRASGIRLLLDGQPMIYRARGEMIVSAGTVGTPAILMRSGVGPGSHLQAMDIPIVHDAAEVGRNLQEHACYPCVRFVDVQTYNVKAKPASILFELAKYLLFRRGMMTAAPVQAIAFLRSRADLTAPDVKLAFTPMAFDVAGQGFHKNPGVTIQVIASKPRSRGEIRLRSADARDKPLVDHRLLGHAADVASILGGIRQVERIFAAPSLSGHVKPRGIPDDCPIDDDDWDRRIRRLASNGYQPVGSCRMGPDTGSVVDPRLRVRGVSALRIADASIMPTMPAGNTNGPAIMIGEKAAMLVMQDR